MFKIFIEILKKQFFSKKNYSSKLIFLLFFIYFILFVLRLFTGLFGYDNLYKFILNKFSLSSDIFSLKEKPWSLFTFIFINNSLWSLFWASINIAYFSNMLSYFVNQKKILKIYIVGILGGAITFLFFFKFVPKFNWQYANLIGIESLSYGVLTAATVVSPNYPISFFFIREMKLKYLLFLFLINSLYLIDAGNFFGLSQFGGALFSYIYMNIFHNKGLFSKIKKFLITRS
jgi:membrane associated rhomboid family serine protease